MFAGRLPGHGAFPNMHWDERSTSAPSNWPMAGSSASSSIGMGRKRPQLSYAMWRAALAESSTPFCHRQPTRRIRIIFTSIWRRPGDTVRFSTDVTSTVVTPPSLIRSGGSRRLRRKPGSSGLGPRTSEATLHVAPHPGIGKARGSTVLNSRAQCSTGVMRRRTGIRLSNLPRHETRIAPFHPNRSPRP